MKDRKADVAFKEQEHLQKMRHKEEERSQTVSHAEEDKKMQQQQEQEDAAKAQEQERVQYESELVKGPDYAARGEQELFGSISPIGMGGQMQQQQMAMQAAQTQAQSQPSGAAGQEDQSKTAGVRDKVRELIGRGYRKLRKSLPTATSQARKSTLSGRSPHRKLKLERVIKAKKGKGLSKADRVKNIAIKKRNLAKKRELARDKEYYETGRVKSESGKGGSPHKNENIAQWAVRKVKEKVVGKPKTPRAMSRAERENAAEARARANLAIREKLRAKKQSVGGQPTSAAKVTKIDHKRKGFFGRMKDRLSKPFRELRKKHEHEAYKRYGPGGRPAAKATAPSSKMEAPKPKVETPKTRKVESPKPKKVSPFPSGEKERKAVQEQRAKRTQRRGLIAGGLGGTAVIGGSATYGRDKRKDREFKKAANFRSILLESLLDKIQDEFED